MVIQCPECNTQYNLPEDRLGPAGKKVRCARCSALFFAGASSAIGSSENIVDDILAAPSSAPSASDKAIEDAFDFDAVVAPEDTPQAPALDDGFADGFVTELPDDDFADELADDINLESALSSDDLGESLDDSLTDFETEAAELDDALPVVEEASRRSPMSTVLLIILLLLLALIAGTGYLMITDGVDAPLRFIERLLAE